MKGVQTTWELARSLTAKKEGRATLRYLEALGELGLRQYLLAVNIKQLAAIAASPGNYAAKVQQHERRGPCLKELPPAAFP